MNAKAKSIVVAAVAGLAVTLVSGCASTAESIQKSAGEAIVATTADAIVRNANAIALGDPVTQEDLDQSAAEALSPMPEYKVSGLGSGDSPALTLTWSKDGVTCSAKIAKADPGAAEVSVVSAPTCS